jgi:hypothetical protein
MSLIILGALLLTAGALWLEPPVARRLAATGVLLVAVAWDSLAIGMGNSPLVPLLLPADGSAFLRIDAALIVVGVGCLLVAVAMSARSPLRILPSVAGLVLAVPRLWPILAAAGWRALSATAGVAILVGALAAAGMWLGRRAAAEPDGASEVPPWHGWPHPWAAIAAVGALGAIAGPHLLLVVAGGVLAAIANDARRWALGRRVPWATLAALPLVPATWLLVRIAAPIGLGLAALVDAPLSEPAQALLLPPIVLAAAPLAGLWPLHRVASPLLAPVGAALLLRLAAPILPDGVVHWQPLLFALTAAGVWWGAASGQPTLIATSLGLAGAASAGRWPWIGAVPLFLLRPISALLGGRLRRPGWRPLWLLAIAGGALVLDAGLRREVTLTVLVAAGLVVAIWRRPAEISASR